MILTHASALRKTTAARVTAGQAAGDVSGSPGGGDELRPPAHAQRPSCSWSPAPHARQPCPSPVHRGLQRGSPPGALPGQATHHTAAATARSAGSARPVEVAGVGVLIALVLAGIAAVAPKADSTPADRPDPAPIVDTTDGR